MFRHARLGVLVTECLLDGYSNGFILASVCRVAEHRERPLVQPGWLDIAVEIEKLTESLVAEMNGDHVTWGSAEKSGVEVNECELSARLGSRKHGRGASTLFPTFPCFQRFP